MKRSNFWTPPLPLPPANRPRAPPNGACTQAMAAKRILYLHESALSHAEYTQYVESFNELVEGDRTQFATVSVREVRGWLKGRYAANNTVDAATIDKVLHISFSPPATSVCSLSQTQHRSSWLTSGYLITLHRLMLTLSLLFSLIVQILRLFYPQLASADSFTAGQFYAVLRLITHVQNGKEVDESLVFSQRMSFPVSTLLGFFFDMSCSPACSHCRLHHDMRVSPTLASFVVQRTKRCQIGPSGRHY